MLRGATVARKLASSLSIRLVNNEIQRSCLRSMSSDSKKFRVLVTRQIPEVAIQIELDIFEHRDKAIPAEELEARVKSGVDGLLVLLTDKVSKSLMEAAGSRLKIVSTMSVGYNHVDTGVLKEKGVLLGYTPDCLTETTADLTVTLLLTTARRVSEGMAAVRDGSWGVWEPLWMCGKDVHGSTVGIIGLGRIGLAVAKRLKAFDCKIIYSGPREKPAEAALVGAEFVTEEELLGRSDFVVPMFPLNQHTMGYFNSERLSKMRKDGVLINATRGEAVVQDDLYKALKGGTILAAGLDVTTPEPLPTDSPLLSLPNCTIFPHIGSATVATREKMALMAAENIAAYATGKPVPFQAKL